MSIWADIQDRSCGLKDRKEDELLTKIKDILSSTIVDDTTPPIRMFTVQILPVFCDKIQLYTIILKAVIQKNGVRNFYCEENISHLMNMCKYGQILTIS